MSNLDDDALRDAYRSGYRSGYERAPDAVDYEIKTTTLAAQCGPVNLTKNKDS